MATTKKTGILGKMKNAVAGMFSSESARKSPKHVEAGKKASTTAKVNKAVKATRTAVKTVAKKVGAPAKTAAGKSAAKKGK